MFKLTICLTLLLGFLAIGMAHRIHTSNEKGLRDSSVNIDPFLQIGSGYYYIEKQSKVNWFDANNRCHALGAQLVAFESMEEWDAVNKYLADHKMNDVYWTSGNDLHVQGSHVWAATGLPVDLANIWADNQPDNGDNQEHCLELGYKHKSKRKGLNDDKCSSQIFFICEINPTTILVSVW